MLSPRRKGVPIGVMQEQNAYLSGGASGTTSQISVDLMRVLAYLMPRCNTPAFMVIWRAICCNLLDIRKWRWQVCRLCWRLTLKSLVWSHVITERAKRERACPFVPPRKTVTRSGRVSPEALTICSFSISPQPFSAINVIGVRYRSTLVIYMGKMPEVKKCRLD